MLRLAQATLLAPLFGLGPVLMPMLVPLAHAQETRPAPAAPNDARPSPGTAGTDSMDMNWLWLVLVILVVVAALYWFQQRRRAPPHL